MGLTLNFKTSMRWFIILALAGMVTVALLLVSNGNNVAKVAHAVGNVHCVPNATIDPSCTDGHADLEDAVETLADDGAGDRHLTGSERRVRHL